MKWKLLFKGATPYWKNEDGYERQCPFFYDGKKFYIAPPGRENIMVGKRDQNNHFVLVEGLEKIIGAKEHIADLLLFIRINDPRRTKEVKK